MSHPSSVSNPPSEPDLMTFDSIDDALGSMNHSLHRSLAAQGPPSPFSFPDTLVPHSPANRPTPEQFKGHMDILVDVHDKTPTINIQPSQREEQTQETQDHGEDQSSANATHKSEQTSPSLTLPHTTTLCPPDSPATSTTPVAEDLPHTPLRRSSRPRKSATLHLSKYLVSHSPNKSQTSPLPSTPSSSRTRKSKKGKERAVTPPTDEPVEVGQVERESKADPFKLDGRPSDENAQGRFSRSPTRQGLARELGSLSPNSAELLTRLIPSVPTETETPFTHNPEPDEQRPPPTFDQPFPSMAQDKSASSSTGQKQATLILGSDSTGFSTLARIPATPRRSYIPLSPSKLRLQPMPMDDPSQTPARRVPFEQAIAEGRISPQKLSHWQSGTPAPVSMLTGQTMPVLNTSLKGDDSPARRVFIPPSTSHDVASRPESPSKRHLGEVDTRQTNHSAGTSVSQKAEPVPRSAKLPFPLVAAAAQSAPEINGGKSGESSSPSSASKSSLKQTTSRIPRKKPYSKPQAIATVTSTERKTTAKLATPRPGDVQKSSGGTILSRKTTGAAKAAVVSVHGYELSSHSTWMFRARGMMCRQRKRRGSSEPSICLSPASANKLTRLPIHLLQTQLLLLPILAQRVKLH
jgi:hypothetical protein